MPEAACVILRDDRERVLLVRENYGERRWGFPGGRVDEGESVADAAVREALEEAGVTVALRRLLGSLAWVDGPDPWTAYVFEGSHEGRAEIQNCREIESVAWFEPSHLPTPLTRTATAWATNALSSPVPTSDMPASTWVPSAQPGQPATEHGRDSSDEREGVARH